MRRNIILLAILFCTMATFAQERAFFSLGFKAGAAYSGISNIPGMFYPEDHFDPSTFQTSTQDVWGALAGIYVKFSVTEFEDKLASFSIQPEVLYTMQGTKFFYEDNQDFNCNINFKYQYVSLGLLFKGDIKVSKRLDENAHVLSIQAGPKIGFNLVPQSLEYTASSNRFGDANDVVQAYRNVLKGRADFAIGVGLAFKFGFGLGFDAMYYFGISDVIETQVNNYDFVDNTNKSHSVQMSLFYDLNFSKGKSKGYKPKGRYR